MRNFPYPETLIISGFAALAMMPCLEAAPVIPGLHRNHPLNEQQQCEVMINELRCASCHEGMSPSPSAPDLRDVGSRLNPAFIRKFIENPAAHDPGTAMPDLLGGLPAAERGETAAAISAYLLSLNTQAQPTAPGPAPEDGSGPELYHQAGCVACHSPLDKVGVQPDPGSVGLGHVGMKYTAGGLAAFLQEPLKVRPDGRMPDMKLSQREANLLAVFLIGMGGLEAPAVEPTAATEFIATGKAAFASLGCAACHSLDGKTQPLAAPPLAKLDPARGCLSETPGKAPNYSLDTLQRNAIRKAIAAKPSAPIPADAIKLRLTALNCISCHQRDDYGGVPQELDSFFHSTEEALGNESRIPPPLTLTGAKLRPEWMKKVLYEAERVRPYMTTRMPQYGSEALDGLAELFGAVDKLEPFDFPPVPQASDKATREAATQLLGDKGLNCIACHNYNGSESPGMKGLDIMTSYQRLQPAWFNQFMQNPAAYRPGIIMPSFWPSGKALQTEILGGDADAQLGALWLNFSLGRSARDPSGLRVEDPKLTVGDKTVTYRGRSTVAGYRGIAVGFPGGLNYAFNAQSGALSAIWSGDFVRVGWNGQGSGNFTPLAPVIQLPQDVAFLTEAADPWPLAPVRTKENPVNPDPLYPRQHGYAFQGYSIGESGIPTFRYRCGGILIEDTTKVSEKSLERKFTFTDLYPKISFSAPMPETLWFRALTGDIKAVSETVFQTPDIKITVPPKTATLRPRVGGVMELLLKITLPGGKSNATLGYELLR